MRIPLPNVGSQSPATPSLSGGNVQPIQDDAGAILQQAGQGLQQLGAATSQVEAWYDEGKAKEAENLFSDLVREKLYHPETGYLQTVGQDARGAYRKAAFDAIREGHDKLRSKLTTDRQRELFRTQAERISREASFDADMHEAKQMKAFAMGSIKAREESKRIDALRFVGTSEFDAQAGAMLEETNRFSQERGFAPDSDVAKMARLEATTKLHTDAIGSLVTAGRSGEAMAHLAKYGDQIAPEDRAQLGKIVQKAGDDSVALDASLRMEQTGLPLMAQRAQLLEERKAGKLTDPQFEGAWARMRVLDAEKAQQEAQAKATLLQDVKNRLMQGGGTVDTLDPATKQALVDAKLDGVARAFEMGGKPKLTTVGMHFRYGAADEELRSMSEAQVINTLSGHMPEDDLGAVLTRWKVVTGQGSDEDAVKQDADLLIQIGAKDAGYLPDLRVGATLSSLQPDVAEKLTRYGITVRDRVRANLKPGEKPTTQHYRDAIEELKGERLKDNTPVALATPAQLQAGAFETPFGDVDVQHLVGLDGQGTPEAMRILADLQADEDQAAAIDGRRPRKLGLRDAVEEFARSTQAKNVEAQRDTRNLRERGLEYFRQLYRNNAARVDLSRYGDPYQASSVIIGQILRPQMGEVKRRPPNIAQRFRGEPGTPYANEVNQLIFAYGITYEEAAAAMREASGLSEPQGRIGVERQRMDPKDVGEIAGSVVTFPTAEMPR